MQKIPSVQLNTGVSMPAIGFGTWQIRNGKEAKNAVLEAIKTGYRLVDTARIYGNEKSVGEAIKESGIDRKELFITTKLWNDDQGYDSALEAFDESMKKLGLDYLDLYLIHWCF
jgi:diketogulonate reductase-like aldo/keto reductase